MRRGLGMKVSKKAPESLEAVQQWFERRLDLGERQVLTAASASLAQDLGELAWPLPPALEGASIRVQRTSALRLARLSGTFPDCGVALGGRVPAELALLALHGAPHADALESSELSAEDRALLVLHLGGTRLVHLASPAVDIDQLLETAGRALLPPRGAEEAGRAFLHRVGRDQPHHEIERIASGFHSARTDRLHRAWERGFFVPRGMVFIAPDS